MHSKVFSISTPFDMKQLKTNDFVFISTVLLFCASAVWSDANKEYQTLRRLKTNLLKNYNRQVRPIEPHRNSTQLFTGVAPLFLTELDEKKQLLKFDIWFPAHWVDNRLRWNTSEYGGINMIHLGDHTIWQPDIKVYQSYKTKVNSNNNTHVLLFSSGDVYWVPPASLTLFCQLNYDNFPNDEQVCQFLLGSWTYHGYQIEVRTFEDVDMLSYFQETNVQWKVTNITARNAQFNYLKYTVTYLEYAITLRRKSAAYLQVAWGPSLAILLMSLSMFWLPPTMKKIFVGSISLLCLALLLVYVASRTPSPAAIMLAVSPLLSIIYIVASEMILEIFVVSIPAITGGLRRPPERIMDLLKSNPCRPLVVCFYRPIDHLSTEQALQKRLTPQDEWNLLSIAIDRVLFVVFVVVVGIFYGS